MLHKKKDAVTKSDWIGQASTIAQRVEPTRASCCDKGVVGVLLLKASSPPGRGHVEHKSMSALKCIPASAGAASVHHSSSSPDPGQPRAITMGARVARSTTHANFPPWGEAVR